MNWVESDIVHRKNDTLVFGVGVDIAAVAPKGVVVPGITGLFLVFTRGFYVLTCFPYRQQNWKA